MNRPLTRRTLLATALSAAAAAALAACARRVGLTTTPEPVVTASLPSPAARATPAAVATASPGAAMPACVVRPAQAEGPFFVDERLERADIRPDPTDGSVRQGVPISLAFQVARVEAGGCTPLAGAIVDLWHCDAAGAYSDVPQAGTGGKQFLRGFQRTDQTGTARFVTVYPGWYQGRAVHVHFKIRDSSHEFTSQLYFDEALSEHIFQQEPYAARGGRMVRNSQDSLYRNGGQDLMLDVKPEGAGFAARFEIGLRM